MKIIFLAPGLARIKRGLERFYLELAGEMRRAGHDAICWGTSEAPGVEAIPVPSRIELEKFANEHLQSVPGLPAVPASALQDWSLYTEDQLFALPTAMRIKKLLDKGESLLVYARWQGGLVDPSGTSTELLKTLSDGVRQGKAALLVHTDYIYAPIASMLWAAGACFHALGPWISSPLRQMGVMPDAIVELPMCIHGVPYRASREHRQSVRAHLGIPPDAFVVLSVGVFDMVAKRHDYVLGEIQKLAGDNVWWVVAGSRGRTAAAWEQEARRALGPRFVPVTDVPFEDMPRLYGAADLFASASLYETFGLVYLEAQMAGLPVVIHDSPITRHLFAQLPDGLKGPSLIDMRRPGAGAAAISRWMALLASTSEHESTRAALDTFGRVQEKQFGWDSMSVQFAAAFDRVMRSSVKGVRGERQTLGAWDEQLHRQGVHLFQEGKHSEALVAISKALGGRETAERWNDWATVQSAMANPREAEQGFRRALGLTPGHAQAAANLGLVLAAAGKFADAIPFLEQAIPAADETLRNTLKRILDACHAKLHLSAPHNDVEIEAFLKKQNARKNGGEALPPEQLSYCTTLLKEIPGAARGQRLLGIGPYGEVLASPLARFNGYEVQWHALACGSSVESSEGRIAVEKCPWQFPDGSFDVVVFAQTLETIADDPMRVFSEINRVLKPGGVLVLTAANIASAKSLQAVLRGGTPYVDGRFPVVLDGGPRHHREYTASEIEALASAGGFGGVQILTRDIFGQPPATLMTGLAASGFNLAARGDTIFLLARKESPVRDRFPGKLYDLRKPKSRVAMETGINAPMRILVVFETLPLPDGGGADHRLMQILRLLREQGHAVTFLAPRSMGNAARASALKELGVEVRVDDAEVLRQEGFDIVPKWTLEEVLREGQFDLAILSLWFWMGVTLPEHYLDEIRRLSPATRIGILTDDCHGIREEGGAEISGLWSDRERAVDFAERETEIYRRSDLVISISNADKDKIARLAGGLPVDVLPMMIEAGPPGPGFEERDGLVYLGHYNNPPTLDGLEWYLREVAPLVRRELPGVKTYVVGTGLPEGWISTDPNVVRVGFKLDLAPEFALRRMLVSPVRFGTGVKTKNLHALAHGLPIVTNTKGADGADFVAGETALIADDPRDFAAAVVRLHTDAALWKKLSENSRTHSQQHFSKGTMDAALRVIVNRTRGLEPQPYDPAHAWSMRLVEKMFVGVLNYQPAKHRHTIRILAYARAADQFLTEGNRLEARRQLRHTFNFASHEMSRSIFFSRFHTVAESMERTYRAVGEATGAAEFRREGRYFSAGAFAEPPAAASSPALPESPASPAADLAAPKDARPRRNGKSSAKLDFSVIVPTYNRSEVLAECLQALNSQSLSPRRFEVIVVDDGSSNATRELCSAHQPRHEFHYVHQENAGTGAARRASVERARGKYLLLINDDTIASRELLARHLELQRAHASEKVAVLGGFSYPKDAKKRALTWFLGCHPFLFPQATLKPGIYVNNSFFVTCNISARRDAVLAAGSFDPAFRVAEDTDLGIRLIQDGLKILYAPEIEAIHQHLDFTIPDLIQRAQVYGNTMVKLYEKHPSLLAEGKEPFGNLDTNSLNKLHLFIDEHEGEVPRATESLAKFDSMDFIPFFSNQIDGKNAAEEVMSLFARSIPIVYWYHLFRAFLAAKENDTSPAFSSVRGELVAQSIDA